VEDDIQMALKEGVRAWTGLIWLRIKVQCRALMNMGSMEEGDFLTS
jgi:hypothetical protein